MEFSPLECFQKAIATRIDQSKDWLTETLRLMEIANAEEERVLRKKHQEMIRERRQAILTRIGREARSLFANHRPEIEAYFQACPARLQKLRIILDLTDNLTSKASREPKQHIADIDIQTMTDLLANEGIIVKDLIVWGDGVLLYHGQRLTEGDEIGIEIEGKLSPMTINQITRNEMKVKNQETRWEVVVTTDDLNTGRYQLLT
jgi:hypothetical protein